jgi:predicted alpha/beta hydrolase family esterase
LRIIVQQHHLLYSVTGAVIDGSEMPRPRSNPPLLIVPGLGGSDSDHWQSHWEQIHPGATRVAQHDWDNPDLESWLQQLHRHVAQTPHAVLVGHSLGCVLIAGALLVAPADVDFAERLAATVLSFTPTPLRPLPFPALVVASTNDPYITLGRARELADAWRAKLVNVGACGHINSAAGFGRWRGGDRVLIELQDIIRSNRNGHHQQQHRKIA